MNGFAMVSAAFMLVTAITHSVLGERRLIQPMLALDTGVLHVPLARQIVRFAWHFTSLLMALLAATVVWPGTPRTLIHVIGIGWLAVGLFDLVHSRGKHVGWPVITGAGLAALFA